MEHVDKMVLVPVDKYEGLTPRTKRGVQQGKEDVNTPLPTAPSRKRATQKTEDLMTFLKRKGKGLLEWNHSGEIVYKGRTILGSNIKNLVKDAKRRYNNFDPVGDREFYRAMAEMNVPKRLVGNEDRWEDILYYQQSKPAYVLPPPGLPNVASKHLDSTPKRVTKTKWLKVK